MEYRSATTAARSEKNLKKAEEWGLKALAIKADSSNAHIPYFLATEVYFPQKKWIKFNDMLDLALEKDPNQNLEKPYLDNDGKLVKTIEEGSIRFKEDAWIRLFNESSGLLNNYLNDTTKNSQINPQLFSKLELCKSMNPKRKESYELLIKIFAMLDKKEQILITAYSGLKNIPCNEEFISSIIDFANDDISEMEVLLDIIEKSAEDRICNESNIEKHLLTVYLYTDNNSKALELGSRLEDRFFDDADVLFNIAFAYQKIASKDYDSGYKIYTTLEESSDMKKYQDAYDFLLNAKIYFIKSIGLFLDSSNLSESEKAMQIAKQAIQTMRKNQRSCLLLLDSIEGLAIQNRGLNIIKG